MSFLWMLPETKILFWSAWLAGTHNLQVVVV